MRKLTPLERLVIAIDLKPNLKLPLEAMMLDLLKQAITAIELYANLGVTLKFNSLARAFGYQLLQAAKAFGVEVFLDFKLIDIDETMRIDGMIWGGAKPRFVTCMAQNRQEALKGLKAELQNSNVLAVTMLTTLTESDCKALYGDDATIAAQTMKFARWAKEAGLDGTVSSAKDAPALREALGEDFLLTAAGIRPKTLLVAGDDQNPDRVMTPSKADAAGVNIFVIGRPVTGHANPRDAVQMVLDEIGAI